MAIPPERLEKYGDFVGKHSTNGVYDPEKGLGGLLSVLTPDPKIIVLAGMQPGTVYFSKEQLYKDLLTWLGNTGVPGKAFPIADTSAWSYCRRERDPKNQDGSLVKAGAVVKQTQFKSDRGGRETGYIKSAFGQELAVPLLPYICEFVDMARQRAEQKVKQGITPNTFDSMWRVLGSIGSVTAKRRPTAVFKVIRFLIENPGIHRETDIEEGLNKQEGRSVLSKILINLGDAGIIDYDSSSKDIGGDRARGWSTYRLSNGEKVAVLDSLYEKIRTTGRYLRAETYIGKVAGYIKQNPEGTIEYNTLAEKLGIHPVNTSQILTLMSAVGILDSQSGFNRTTRSRASANDLTRMFYEVVLLLVKEAAGTLTQPPAKPLDPLQLTCFLQNYQQERSNIGSIGGKEVRERLVDILSMQGKPIKLSHIVEIYNASTGRKLIKTGLSDQLNDLIQQGIVRKPRKGFYILS